MLNKIFFLMSLFMFSLSAKATTQAATDYFIQGLEIAQIQMNQVIQSHEIRQQEARLDSMQFQRQEAMK